MMGLDMTDHPIKSILEMMEFPSREEIEGVLKYLKNNKAAGSDSILTELLNNGGPWTKLGECLARADPAGLDQRDSIGKLDQKGTVFSVQEKR
jgi:hypothetical protein